MQLLPSRRCGRAVFHSQSGKLRLFDEAFLASFNLSWQKARLSPTWRDVIRQRYTLTTHQEELEQHTLRVVYEAHECISSGTRKKCIVPLSFIEGAHTLEVLNEVDC